MKQNEKPKRNRKGDIESPKISPEFWEKQREREWTYSFQFKDKYGYFMPVNYEDTPFRDLSSNLPKFDLVTVEIFKSPPEPPWDNWMKWKGEYEHYLEKYFRPVFANKPRYEGRQLDIDKTKIILPKEKLDAFKAFITVYKLTKHEDFLLFLLAKIEETYIDDIEYYDRPEQRERIKKFPGEIDKLIEALKLTESNPRKYDDHSHPPKLEQIIFQFNKGTPIKITDSILLSSITDATRKSFDDGSRKDWEKQLRSFPSIYNENQQPNEFRHRMCKALHNFFKGINAFAFGKNKTTDAEMYAIAWMMNFANVRFYNKAGKEYDFEIDKYELRQIVRLNVNRKELVYRPTHYTVADLKPDLKKLSEYFSADFLRAGGPVYKEFDLRQVFTITDRFGVNQLAPELLHVFACLNQYHFIIGHQLETSFNKDEIEKNDDYRSLKVLLDTLKGGQNIKELQFKVEGNSEKYGFMEKLPLEILKLAILEFYEAHKPEFEVDLYESKLEIVREGFRILPTGKLNEPHQRFLPLFVKNCYGFLIKEAPPGENDWSPSERYYGVISMLLLRSWYFGHQMWDERHIVEQVKYWHSLTQDES